MLDDKIVTFITVAETGNYTKAAEKLNITQPAVTQHIRKLEDYYKCRLIDWKGKNFKLTREGKILYDYTKVSVANELRLEKLLKKTEYNIRCGATLSIADYYLDGYLSSYINAGNNINIIVSNTEHLTESIKSGELDCAFVEGYFDKNVFESYELIEEEFIMVAGAGHPLTGYERVTLSMAEEYPLLIREFGSGTRAVLETYLEKNSKSVREFKRSSEIGSFLLIKKLLMTTNAVTFVYRGVAGQEIDNGTLVHIPIEGVEIKKKMHFIYLRDSYLKDVCRSFFKSVYDIK